MGPVRRARNATECKTANPLEPADPHRVHGKPRCRRVPEIVENRGTWDCVENTLSACLEITGSAWIKYLLLMIFSLQTSVRDFTVKIINRSDQENAALYGKI